MPVRMRIQLLDVVCRDPEDALPPRRGTDEFYIIGGVGVVIAGAEVNPAPVLTKVLSITKRDVKPIPDQPVIFDQVIPNDSAVALGVKAFDEDFAKDWNNEYRDMVNKTGAALVATAGVVAVAFPVAAAAAAQASKIVGAVVGAANIIGPMDQDDELGTLEGVFFATGSADEVLEWNFSHGGSGFLGLGNFSDWNYSVRYRITREDQDYAAAFVEQSVPRPMANGQQFPVAVKMRNTGALTWTPDGPNNFLLGSQNPQDGAVWGRNRVPLPHPVPPGSEVVFQFDVTAPGNTGGFNFQWQMLHEGVRWFGDLTPNVVIPVAPPQAPPTCSGLIRQHETLRARLIELSDLLTDDPRRDAQIRRQIAQVSTQLARVKQQASDIGCGPIP